MYPQVSLKIRSEIESGGMGQEIKDFYMQHKESDLECENSLYQCPRCSDLSVMPRIKIKTKEGIYEKHNTCSKCSHITDAIHDPLNAIIQRPKCNRSLKFVGYCMWD